MHIANKHFIVSGAASGLGAATAQMLVEAGATGPIIVVCALAAPEGLQFLQETDLDLIIYTASIDERLNENAYIVPGLGDAGDRQFGAA